MNFIFVLDKPHAIRPDSASSLRVEFHEFLISAQCIRYLEMADRWKLRYVFVCNVLHVYNACAGVHCYAEQHIATHCDAQQHTAAHCSTLQHATTRCITLQHTVAHCSTLQHTATHCNTLHSCAPWEICVRCVQGARTWKYTHPHLIHAHTTNYKAATACSVTVPAQNPTEEWANNHSCHGRPWLQGRE